MVPKQLTEVPKQIRMDICQKDLNRYGDERNIFLETIPMTKHGSIVTSWRVNGRVWNGNVHNRPARKIQNQPSSGKLMLTVFWDSKGPVPEHYQERGTATSSARYSEMLTDWLKPAIRSMGVSPGELSDEIVT